MVSLRHCWQNKFVQHCPQTHQACSSQIVESSQQFGRDKDNLSYHNRGGLSRLFKLHLVDESDKFFGGNAGLYQITVGHLFDLSLNIVVLVQIVGYDYLAFETWA